MMYKALSMLLLFNLATAGDLGREMVEGRQAKPAPPRPGSRLLLEMAGSVPQASSPKSSHRSLGSREPTGKRLGLVITCSYPGPDSKSCYGILKFFVWGMIKLVLWDIWTLWFRATVCPQTPVNTYVDGEQVNDYLEEKGFDVTWMHDCREKVYLWDNLNPWSNYNANLFTSSTNMKTQLKAFANKCESGDVLYVHYSGHGTQCEESNSTSSEQDGRDEAICPTEGDDITDDWLYENFVCNIDSGVQVIFVANACHSGTILDLPYRYFGTPTTGEFKRSDDRKNHPEVSINEGASILCISACEDNQTAICTSEISLTEEGYWETNEGVGGGDLTIALLSALDPQAEARRIEDLIEAGEIDRRYAPEIPPFNLKLLVQKLYHGCPKQDPQISCTKGCTLFKRPGALLDEVYPFLKEEDSY